MPQNTPREVEPTKSGSAIRRRCVLSHWDHWAPSRAMLRTCPNHRGRGVNMAGFAWSLAMLDLYIDREKRSGAGRCVNTSLIKSMGQST